MADNNFHANPEGGITNTPPSEPVKAGRIPPASQATPDKVAAEEAAKAETEAQAQGKRDAEAEEEADAAAAAEAKANAEAEAKAKTDAEAAGNKGQK